MNPRKEKKLKRKEELARQKVFQEAVRGAYLREDHLADFPAFTKFDRNGLSVTLESKKGSALSASLKQYAQNLLKINMENFYGKDWHEEAKIKWREMVAEDALYIFAHLNIEGSCKVVNANIEGENNHGGLWKGPGAPGVAFAQYRFIIEEVPVLYVYELQLEKIVQRKGLGKFLMQLLELIARKNNMDGVVLTVQKRNEAAMRFYMNKLSYKISSISPSRVNALEYADCSYEILCKAFDSHAKMILEDDSND